MVPYFRWSHCGVVAALGSHLTSYFQWIEKFLSNKTHECTCIHREKESGKFHKINFENSQLMRQILVVYLS